MGFKGPEALAKGNLHLVDENAWAPSFYRICTPSRCVFNRARASAHALLRKARMSVRRSKLDIMLSVLSTIKEGVDKPTKIMYARANSIKYIHSLNVTRGGILPTAFVLINAEIGAEDEVMRNLEPFSEVKEAHMVYGAYDIIARLETETMQDLKEAISWKIRRLDKVRSTLTMVVVE